MPRRVLFAFLIPFALLNTVFAQTPTLERAMADREDEAEGYQVHVMYVLPSDGTDEQLDTNSTIAGSVAAFQTWLADQTGGSRLRMDTYEGMLDITFLALGRTDTDLGSYGVFIRDALETELIGAGFNDPHKLYAVYYGGSAVDTCGGGPWPPQLIGSVAAMYLKGKYTDPSIPLCSDNPFATAEDEPGYLEFTMLHEIFHSIGAVGECAPNHTREGHVSDDPRDLMYAGDEAWQPSILDTGFDDYFGHNNPDCLDVADSVFLDPLPPNAVRPPGWPEIVPTVTAGTNLTQIAEGSCSESGDIAVNITFVNASSQEVEIHWISYECAEVQYAVLPAGMMVVQPTFVSHPWRVRSAADGSIMAETIPIDGEPYTVTISD